VLISASQSSRKPGLTDITDVKRLARAGLPEISDYLTVMTDWIYRKALLIWRGWQNDCFFSHATREKM